MKKLKKTGVVYRRTDASGNLKPYAGQAKSKSRYEARQREHARDNSDSDFEFEIIDKGDPSGRFPTDLDVKEQKSIRQNGWANK